MYIKSLETDKEAKIARDNNLKANAKERIAGQKAYKKKQKLDRGAKLARLQAVGLLAE